MRNRVILLSLLLTLVMTVALPVRASEKEKGTTEGKDTSMTMLFLIVAFVLAEGSVLYFFGEKHDG